MKTVDGKLYIFSGASRTGKSAKATQLVNDLKSQTVFVWDIEAQWCMLPGYKKVSSLAELKRIVVSGKKGKYAVVYIGPNMQEGFDQFCACVFHYAQYFGECVCVAEELADVTTVSKAPQFWGMLVRRGLKRGLSIIAISQRWQEADKTAIGNAQQMFIFAPSTYDDGAYIARKIGRPADDVMNLKPFQYLKWVKFEGVKFELLKFKK